MPGAGTRNLSSGSTALLVVIELWIHEVRIIVELWNHSIAWQIPRMSYVTNAAWVTVGNRADLTTAWL